MADVSINTHKITNLVDPSGLQDAATKNYVDTQISNLVASAPDVLDTLQELADALQNNPDIIQDLQDAIAGKVAKAGDTMTGNLDMNSNSVVNLAAPVSNGDAANKLYVDT